MANVYCVLKPVSHIGDSDSFASNRPLKVFASAVKAFEFASEWLYDDEVNISTRQELIQELEISESCLSDFSVLDREGKKVDTSIAKNYFRGNVGGSMLLTDSTKYICVEIVYMQTE